MTKQLEQIHAELETVVEECKQVAITLKAVRNERDELKRENQRLRQELGYIANIEANRFPDNSTWRDLAKEAISIARKALTPEASNDGTLTIKK